MSPLLAAAFAPNYELGRELGRGGMATVYLARDLRHERFVAIKVLHPTVAAAVGAERFLREIRIAAHLQHPHILPVFDSGECDCVLWYAMPFVDGESLRDRLRREGTLSSESALRIAREVAEALDYAHRHGVVHRDIKPENILLADGQAVVADFGIARPMDTGYGSDLTLEGVVVGTPTYMSPEQGAGSSMLDGRSDLYSLGCVLFEMLTGEPLFRGATPRQVIEEHYRDPTPSFERLPATVPAHVRDVLARLLAQRPEARFQSGAQLAAALSEYCVSGDRVISTGVSGPSTAVAGRPRKLALAAIVLVALAAGFTLLPRVPEPRRLAMAATEVPTVVVLPFENLGQADDEYFADGLTEEITGRLARLPGIRVIARGSAMRYKGTEKPLPQIGKELGATYILEGSVRWERPATGQSRIRVMPRLLDVAGGSYLWAERFDAELAHVFEVQGSIAHAVAGALDLTLRTEQQEALGEGPTTNLDAYGAYLRGNDYFSRAWGSEPNLRLALEMYERATTLDSSFAPAFAKLARVHAQMFWHYHDHTNARLMRAKAAAERALSLQPDLAEGHLAMGFYWYWGYRDYARAVQEFTLAERARPNDPETMSALGSVERRQGRWTEAAIHLQRAADLNPLASGAAWEAGVAYLYMRRYADAERYFDRALSVAPDYALAHAFKAMLYVLWQGDTTRARRAIEAATAHASLGQLVGYLGAARWLLTSDITQWAALDALTIADLQGDTAYYYVWQVEWNRERGRTPLERAYGDSARMAAERLLKEHPDDAMLHAMLSIGYAGMGRKADAIRESERAAELLPITKDAYWGADRRGDLALMYTHFGETDKAIDQLEELLQVPSTVSLPWLRLDPAWRPLWNQPRFRQLRAGATSR